MASWAFNPATMTADKTQPIPKFAFFSNGANFSCEVLQSLLHKGIKPELLVLPEYSPAAVPASMPLMQRHCNPQRRLLRLAAGIEITYAPPALQTSCAQHLQQSAIEFILVACWPYLIDKLVISSVTRGALNLHPSLLPSYRGPDPIGEQLNSLNLRPGVSLHLLNPQFDQGDIVAQAELPDPQTRYQRASLERACAQLGSELFIDALNEYDGGWSTTPQRYIGDVTG